MPHRPPSQARHDPRLHALPAAELRTRFVAFFEARGHTAVPSASLVPAGDPTLLFTNSGMVQFKNVFTGVETRSYKRAVDYQRVLRVAGKHNDFEEVGRTSRHNTFFEMLGNWSFGDYFKRKAIHLAWEFLTDDLGIPPERLAATTYKDDEVARAVWRDEIGLTPDRMAVWGDVDAGDDSNFWRMAETGPCGPCSEIHFDRGPEFSEGPQCIPDHSENCPRWLEIWNLVFMEFDQRPDGRVPLPFPSVDTGMSLERLASVMQQVPSNFDIDLFLPLHARMRELLGHDPDRFEAQRFSYQVVADHARAVTFLVADGVHPSNEGRGYVLRKLVRRAVRHGRLLGRTEPFLGDLASVVIATMGDAYPIVVERAAEIHEVLGREEAQFARTLDAGARLLERSLQEIVPGDQERTVGRRPEDLPAAAPRLPGEVAFRLHDTYGFPIDLTVELAAEAGVGVDLAGYEEALGAQRARSRKGTKAGLSAQAQSASRYEALLHRAGPTDFVGYAATTAEGRVVAIVRDDIEYEELQGHGPAEVVLDATPFYAEGGGQVGDRGVLREPGGGSLLFQVEDTQRPVGGAIGGLTVHRGMLHGRLKVGGTVEAVVDAERRARTMRNHTGTHLLHRALRNTVGQSARQAGSLVTPEGLRFDFPFDRALTARELTTIEVEVRRIIREDRPVIVEVMPMPRAAARGADAFFDEKYGEDVRTVAVEGYSLELCGGTHCGASGQVGGFVIAGERSIGSGTRRIEALTGDAADAYLDAARTTLSRTAEAVGAQGTDAVPARVAELQAQVKDLEKRLKAGGGSVPRPADLIREAVTLPGGARLVARAVDVPSADELKALARDVRGAFPEGVIALGLVGPAPELFVTVSADLVARGVAAGDLVRDAAPLIGGKGGGRPEMAQARGSDPTGLQRALEGITAAVANRLAGRPA